MNTLKSKRSGETARAVFDFSWRLDEDEELTGTPTVVEIGTSDLTISDAAITDDGIILNGKPVNDAKAVTCLVAGGTPTVDYTIRATVSTDDGQTLISTLSFRVN